jgi:hypothetical protein
MDADDKEVFFEAASHFTCWIGLREPNPDSAQWAGEADAIPKPEECKAKTADNPDSVFKGLVVDPTRCAEAFRPSSLDRARQVWEEQFLQEGQPPPGFTVEEYGWEAGLVRYNGRKIFADYDLMTVSRSNERGEFVYMTREELEELSRRVQDYINRFLPKPMIQHGPEFLYMAGVGARASESILWFGPDHRFMVGTSSMPSEPGTFH